MPTGCGIDTILGPAARLRIVNPVAHATASICPQASPARRQHIPVHMGTTPPVPFSFPSNHLVQAYRAP